MVIFKTLKNYKREYLPKDLLTGIVIAAVSIPISMGYAEVAGIPAIYGLYGSVFPILLFAVFSTSPQFIFGVDAAPAAIVGAALASMGITAGSEEALIYVPMMALFTGLWLLLFYFLKAGKLVDYISTPVMGGFISGIAVTIILMQIPKILGSGSGSGELLELMEHIFHAALNIHPLSVLLGVASLLIIVAAGKIIPKFPMAIVVMALGVFLTCVCHVDAYGVRLLAQVEPGLPKLILPDFARVDISQAAGRSLIVAIVVMSETLLSENNFAFRNGYKIEDNREVLACGVGNIAAALVGCCPVNGSISRTSMNDQYGGRTQAVSVVASAVMAILLLFGTGFIGYLPVPVLTAIVISALMKVVEWHLAKRLFQVSRQEFAIFMAAFLGVLVLGTIYGVIIGLVLSFVAVILRETNPPRTFLGMIPHKEGFYDRNKNRYACEIEGVKIYQFSESLFFANIKIFQEDIENCIDEDTKAVIVDMSTVTGIDITAADRLELMAKSFQKKGIHFYLTEHKESVNRQMRDLGIGHLIEEGHVRRTITAALHDLGILEPYPLKNPQGGEEHRLRSLSAETENTLEEFAWAFGEDTVSRIEKLTQDIIHQIHGIPELEHMAKEGLEGHLDAWKWLGAIDEDELVRRLELHMDELPKELHTKENMQLVWKLLEEWRSHIREKLRQEAPEELEKLEAYREKLERRLEKQNPEAAKWLHEWEEHAGK
ncbi:MAG: SulP family inorganic anion transporter [Bacteroidales bacterium]|nr:SulP family inorganic anion transporter [Lachnoclostridium sp.]MCM1383170.1 SulP family inorganic anion transporter [Lachnoclostridium sp.]MCM1464604.1 SulP family inorganic anion transporter [Bacteroidales bacterium]